MARPKKLKGSPASSEASSLEMLLDIQELTQYLKVSRTKIYELMEHDRLPVIRIGGQLRFNPSSIKRWLLDKELA